MNKEEKLLEISTPRLGILQLTLNRPSVLNALNRELMSKIYSSLLGAGRDSSVRALLITGQGRAFCAGADIQELATLNAVSGLEFARYGQAVFNALETLGKPSLAVVQGPAMGGGMELAMAATLRIASHGAIFAQPEVKLGVIPGFGGTQRLARLAGRGRAMAWCLTGQKISAEQAVAAGLVTEIAPPDQLMTKALDLLSEIIQLPPLALRSLMTVICQGHDLSIEEGLGLEAAHFALCCASRDMQEGVSAFLEKRRAVFLGE